MAAPSMLVLVKANLEALKAQMKDATSTIAATTAGAAKLGASLDGSKLEQRAQNMVIAIQSVGGAFALTDKQAQASLKTLDAYIDKATRMGKEIPPAVMSMAESLKRIEPPLTLAQKAAGMLQSTFGQFTLAGLATQGISKLTSEIGAFVATGMKLPAVEQSFGRLTAAAHVNGQAMLANMTASTKGMVSNYDLMTSSNKAMLLGLPVTAAQMGNLAKTATTLGKAMGQDATKSLDDLITALGRSSPMILDNLGLSVKVGEANDLYAAKLHKTAEQLTEAEKKMAFYQAAMEAAKKKTAELGEQTMTLGDIATSVWTQVGNVVTAAAAHINVGIGKILSSKADLIQFFKDMAVLGTPGAAIMAASLRAELASAAAARKSMMGKDTYLETTEHAFARLREESQKLLATVVPLTAAQREVAIAFDKSGLSVAQIAEKMAPFGVSMKAIQNAIDANKKSTTEAATAAKKYGDLVAEVTQANQKLTIAQIAQVKSLDALGVSHSKIADFLGVTDAQISKYVESLKAESKALTEIGKQIDKIPHNVKLRLETTSLSGAVPMIDVEAVKKASDAVQTISDATFGDIEGRMKEMGVNTSADLGRLAAAARERFESMRASGKFTADELAAAWKTAQAATDAALGKTGGLFGSLMADLGKVPGMLIAAFQGGGGGAGAAKGVGSMLGSTLGTHLSDSLKKNGGKMFQGALGDVFSSALPMIGSLIGPLAGAIWNKLFGTAGRDAVKDFAATFKGGFDGKDGLHEALNTLGAEGERLWIKLTQGTGKNNPAQAKATIEEITAALEAQKVKTADLAKAAEETVAAQLKSLDTLKAMMSSGELKALTAGFAEAKAAGFKGAESEFLKQQLEFYGTLEEGDSRLKTYFMASTVNGWGLIAGGHADALEAINAKYTESISKMDSEYKTLSDSVAKESAEDFMGITETLERERMKQIEAEKAAQIMMRDAEIAAKLETFDAMLEEGKSTFDKLKDMFAEGLDIPTRYGVPGFSSGGGSTGGSYVPPTYRDSGGTSGDYGGGSSSRASAGVPGDTHVTVVMPDGDVLLKQVVKAGRRRGWMP